MIFTPWGIGLTLCSFAVLILLIRATLPAILLLIRGEEQDSEFQLKLEREEILSNTILRFALFYLIASPFLITGAAFELGKQIPGAMCAFGVFNANPFGFPLLLARLLGIYLAGAWILLYAADMKFPTTPLRGIRRIILVIVFLLFSVDTVAQTLFFANLSPQVITSCCAVVFDPVSDVTENPAGVFTHFPQPLFFSALSVVMIGIGIIALTKKSTVGAGIYGILSPLYFFFCFAAMISFISPHIYALPHHHCPFCILRGKEAVLGIPLTLLVFAGGLSGWAGGVVTWVARRCSLTEASPFGRRWYLLTSVISFTIFFIGSIGILILYRIFGELL
jgi:hypothetical protein